MLSTAIATVIKMLDPFPLEVQNQAAEHIREYLSDLQDEARWDNAFEQIPEGLVAVARRAKQEIAEGQAIALNYK